MILWDNSGILMDLPNLVMTNIAIEAMAQSKVRTAGTHQICTQRKRILAMASLFSAETPRHLHTFTYKNK